MAMTKKEFLREYASNPRLARKVLNQLTESWSDLKSRPEDFRDAGAGVGGFIYYKDTVPFGKKNEVLILRAVRNFERDTGSKLSVPDSSNETEYYNWLSWFALENTIDDLMRYKEDKGMQ